MRRERRAIRKQIEKLLQGKSDPKTVASKVFRINEDLRIGPIVQTIRDLVQSGGVKPNAKAVEEYVLTNMPWVDAIRLDVTLKTLANVGLISESKKRKVEEEVQENYTYILLQRSEDIPVGTRVKVDSVDRIDDDGNLKLTISTVEPMLPAPEEEGEEDGEETPAEEPEKKDEPEEEEKKDEGVVIRGKTAIRYRLGKVTGSNPVSAFKSVGEGIKAAETLLTAAGAKTLRVISEEEDAVENPPVEEPPKEETPDEEGEEAQILTSEVTCSEDELDLFFDPESEQEPEGEEEETPEDMEMDFQEVPVEEEPTVEQK